MPRSKTATSPAAPGCCLHRGSRAHSARARRQRTGSPWSGASGRSREGLPGLRAPSMAAHRGPQAARQAPGWPLSAPWRGIHRWPVRCRCSSQRQRWSGTGPACPAAATRCLGQVHAAMQDTAAVLPLRNAGRPRRAPDRCRRKSASDGRSRSISGSRRGGRSLLLPWGAAFPAARWSERSRALPQRPSLTMPAGYYCGRGY